MGGQFVRDSIVMGLARGMAAKEKLRYLFDREKREYVKRFWEVRVLFGNVACNYYKYGGH